MERFVWRAGAGGLGIELESGGRIKIDFFEYYAVEEKRVGIPARWGDLAKEKRKRNINSV